MATSDFLSLISHVRQCLCIDLDFVSLQRQWWRHQKSERFMRGTENSVHVQPSRICLSASPTVAAGLVPPPPPLSLPPFIRYCVCHTPESIPCNLVTEKKNIHPIWFKFCSVCIHIEIMHLLLWANLINFTVLNLAIDLCCWQCIRCVICDLKNIQRTFFKLCTVFVYVLKMCTSHTVGASFYKSTTLDLPFIAISCYWQYILRVICNSNITHVITDIFC
jgi:hypothetical protein